MVLRVRHDAQGVKAQRIFLDRRVVGIGGASRKPVETTQRKERAVALAKTTGSRYPCFLVFSLSHPPTLVFWCLVFRGLRPRLAWLTGFCTSRFHDSHNGTTRSDFKTSPTRGQLPQYKKSCKDRVPSGPARWGGRFPSTDGTLHRGN